MTLRDGRVGLRRDLDEVEILPVRILDRLRGRLHSQLLPVFVDEPHLLSADVLVDPAVWDYRPSRLDPASWPQRRFTKLSASSFFK